MRFYNRLPEISVFLRSGAMAKVLKHTSRMILDIYHLFESAGVFRAKPIVAKRRFCTAAAAKRPEKIVHL